MSIIAALLPNQDRLRRLQTAIRGRHQIAPCSDWGALQRLCETQPVATAVFDLFATGEMGLEPVRQLRRLFPRLITVAYVAVGNHDRIRDVFDAGRAGIDGLVLADRDDSPERFSALLEQAEARSVASKLKVLFAGMHPMVRDAVLISVTRAHERLTPEVLAENRAWMQKAGALDDKDVLILCFQSYVVKTPHHTILIDSCIGNDKPRPQRPKWNMKTDDTYARALAAAGFSVGDIDYVMCTHLHVDHVGWNTRLDNGRWVPTFPKARYVFDKTEFDYWTETHAKTPVPAFGDSVLPVVEAKQAEIVRSDYLIGDHTRILPTPGHTPGHVAFTFGRGKDDAVFSGDLMHSPLQTRYPEMSVKFDVDQAQAAATRRSFLERYCDTDTLCCTAHFPSPSVGRLSRWGDGFRCEPAV